MNLGSTIRQFFVENILFQENANLKDETSFFESGIIDSTGLLELIMFLEKKFRISIKDNEVVPENFDCIANLTKFLGMKLIQTH